MSDLKYQRVLLKISGEGFCGTGGFGIDSTEINVIADQIAELVRAGAQVGIVSGAGNLIRGATLSQQAGLNRATADQMGMLATVINSIALQDTLESKGVATRVMSAIQMSAICEPFIRGRAIRHLEKGRVIILAGGTGNPFFTTDTCASLRAAEIQADVIIKATKVDGVYDSDPMKNPDAKMFERLSFVEVLENDLRVMDHSAISMCRENNIDIVVCNLMKPGSVARVLAGEKLGTVISNQ